MIDREKVVTVLRKRFPAAASDQLAAAANAIVGLDDEWEEVALEHSELVRFVEAARYGEEFRVFRRRVSL